MEAWGENGDKLAQKCQVGDLVSIQGAAVVAAPAQYPTSRLHYHLNLKGPLISSMKTLGQASQLCIRWCPLLPWNGSKVGMICVAVTIVENPGPIERQTKDGAALVCNAIVQQSGARVRCSFWHDQAEELAQLERV